MKLSTLSYAAVAAIALTVPALAHHSFAMFDASKTLTVTGTVKELEWVNPHAWLRVTLTDQAGKQALWAFELGPPARQIARGWTDGARTLKPGDSVTLDMHPLRDGSRGGQLVSAILPSGKRVGGAGAPDQE